MSGLSRAAQARTLLRLRRVLAERRRYDHLDEAARSDWRRARLDALRRHAAGRSAWYREAHAGLEGAPLDALPVVTRVDLAERFDDLVAVPGLTAEAIRGAIAAADPSGPAPRAMGFRVATSSGSAGVPTVLAFDDHEWVGRIANAARAQEVAGPPTGTGPVRLARIGSPAPWHLSLQVGATLDDPRRPALSLSAAMPVADLVASLAAWRPTVLSGYPSVLRTLAAEQIAGRLALSLRRVTAGGEPVSDGDRLLVREAWGTEVFDRYATTEGGFLAAECAAHDGLHVIDDDVVVEVVDDHGAAVAAGVPGHRVLITVLGSRTVPLVRYALDDTAVVAEGPCGCGRPGPRLSAVGGAVRAPMVLGAGPTRVSVHPVALTAVLDALPVAGWQVAYDAGRVTVRVLGGADLDLVGATDRCRAALAAAGADVDVVTERVDRLTTGTGKAARFVPLP